MRRTVPSLFRILILVACCATTGGYLAAQDRVYIDEFTGINPYNSSEIRAGVPISVKINFAINTGFLTGCTNGWEFYSPDGATWSPIATEVNPVVHTYEDGGVFVNVFSNDGSGADTIGFGAFKLFATGVPPGYDGWVLTHTFMIDESSVGKTFGLDTAYYPPSGSWSFSTTGGGSLPEWESSQVFTVVPCCVGLRGNSDNSEIDMPMNVGDLDQIINWMFFGGPAPPCMVEADVNASASVDIADVSYIVEYFWLGGPAPQPCP